MTTNLEPLWPDDRKVEVIGVTGPHASGKTLWVTTIDPERTLLYDCEKSAGTYEGLGFTRIDLPDLMTRCPNHDRRYQDACDACKKAKTGTHTSLDVYLRWRDHIRSVEPGKYRVIAVDPLSDIETGLTNWVRANPEKFGHTSSQYQKMQGIFWQDVKDEWDILLSNIASRTETFAFTTHMRREWVGSTPTSKMLPKGKDTLMKLTSLYLLLERKPVKGAVPNEPVGIVIKERLANVSLVNGKVDIQQVLPPRIDKCTPDKIREYMEKPVDTKKLKPHEKLPEAEGLSDDERLALETEKEKLHAEAESTALEREKLRLQAAAMIAKRKAAEQDAKSSGAPDQLPAQQAETQAQSKAAAARAQRQESNGLANDLQIARVTELKKQLGFTDQAWIENVLAPLGIQSDLELTPERADGLIGRMEQRLAKN